MQSAHLMKIIRCLLYKYNFIRNDINNISLNDINSINSPINRKNGTK